ncbi:solute carrier family 15 member 5 [Neoarius graeffei]|uniref:solute carrier family 15 member 5 n=1 Tax=Neoarius graeffei TaxID=443677 RepID=UPI00298D4185|nr:solute carrier family 15 member 5 [Neoarius graeffei]
MVALNVASLHDSHLLQKVSTTCHPSGKVTPRKPRKKVKAIICVLFVELFERFTFLGIVCNMILFCTIKLGYNNYQAATVNLCFVGASTLTPVLAGWLAETCLGRKKVLYLCALLHFFGTALLPVVAFPFEDFYIDTHNIIHHLEPQIQHILFYTGLLAAAFGIGGIRAILCPLGVNNLQGYNQKKILSFFNWIYWLINLNSTVIFLGIAYIQQSVGKNLGFLIPFTSILLGLIGIHMAHNNLILHPKKGSPLLTTLGVFLNSLQMCCLRYRHLSGDVTDWLDRAKENNGGCYSETKVENVKILVKLFPLFGLQLLYRACITQIPSGYYFQTMHSNLNLNGVMLPIAAMNVISILPLLILVPLLEFVSICYQYLKKTPPSPVTFIIIGHVCAALSALIAGISEIHRKDYPQMDQTISGTVLQVSSVPCIHLAPQYILLGMAEAFVTPACSVIAFCLTPINLRGISLHFLTLFYGGGCFLGALLIQFFYFVSGGSFYPNILNNGNMERFFLTLATLMAINTLTFWKISHRYTDLSQLNTRVRQSHLAEKLLQHKACLRYYTMEPYYS